MKIYFSAIILLLHFFPPLLYAENKAPQVIKFETKGKAKFEVLYHRVGTNSTGVIVGGLIGAGIQAGIESDRDETKKAELAPHINQSAWKDLFINEVNDRLLQKNYSAEWTTKKSSKKNRLKSKEPLILLFPEHYGFKLVDTNTHMVSAFVSFKAQLIHNGQEHEKQDYYLIHKTQRNYKDLLANKEQANKELEAVLLKAARRISNKIIYKTKGKKS